MQFVVEGQVTLEIDGRPISVAQPSPDGLTKDSPGTDVPLDAGAHAVRVALTIDHGGRTVIRWNWVPPLASGQGGAGAWTVVPPMVLRPDPPIVVQP